VVIVTGASGFVGRYCVKTLIKRGYEVLATAKSEKAENFYKHSKIPFVRVDITNPEDFKKLPQGGVKAIVHTAGLLSIDRHPAKAYFMVNAYGTYNMLEYAVKTNAETFVYTMTHSDVNRAGELYITEDTPRRFGGKETTKYIASKVAAANLVEAFTIEYGIRGISLRLPGIRGWGSRTVAYWEGKEEKFIFNIFVEKAIKSEPIEIWGEHDTKRDLIYIKNIVDGIIGSLKSEKAVGLYNLGSGQGLTIEDEAKAIIKAFSPFKRPSKLVYLPDVEEVRKRSYVFVIDKAKRDFGYVPKFTYEEAMLDMKRDMEKAGKESPWDEWTLENMDVIVI